MIKDKNISAQISKDHMRREIRTIDRFNLGTAMSLQTPRLGVVPSNKWT